MRFVIATLSSNIGKVCSGVGSRLGDYSTGSGGGGSGVFALGPVFFGFFTVSPLGFKGCRLYPGFRVAVVDLARGALVSSTGTSGVLGSFSSSPTGRLTQS